MGSSPRHLERERETDRQTDRQRDRKKENITLNDPLVQENAMQFVERMGDGKLEELNDFLRRVF